ncbi:MAG: rhodanese-like domain-containing protein [Pseudomonadota bacterium]
MQHWTPVHLRDRLAQSQPPFLLDVRQPWEFEICRLPGSRLIPMHQVPDALSSFDPSIEIVVICHHGVRSRQVARFLESHGFQNVINLEGGLHAWIQDVDPHMPAYRSYRQSDEMPGHAR